MTEQPKHLLVIVNGAVVMESNDERAAREAAEASVSPTATVMLAQVVGVCRGTSIPEWSTVPHV